MTTPRGEYRCVPQYSQGVDSHEHVQALKGRYSSCPSTEGSFCHWRSRRHEERQGKARTKYLVAEQNEWNALSPEAQLKIIEACKKSNDNDEVDTSLASNKSAKIIIKS